MTYTHLFEPSFNTVDFIDVLPLASELRGEKMFYQSSMEFVSDKGGIESDFYDHE